MKIIPENINDLLLTKVLFFFQKTNIMPENINDLYIVNKVFVFFKKMNIIPEDINDLLLTKILFYLIFQKKRILYPKISMIYC